LQGENRPPIYNLPGIWLKIFIIGNLGKLPMQDPGAFEAEPQEGHPALDRSSENFRRIFWLAFFGIVLVIIALVIIF